MSARFVTFVAKKPALVVRLRQPDRMRREFLVLLSIGGALQEVCICHQAVWSVLVIGASCWLGGVSKAYRCRS